MGAPPLILAAALTKEQLIEWGILLFLYFVGPAIGRFVKRRQEEQAAAREQAAASPLAAQPAAASATKASPAPPRPAPPDLEALPALRDAIAAWHAAVAPRYGREAARRLEAVVEARVPSMATGQLLGEAATATAKQLTGQIQRLTRAVERLRHPDQRVLGRAVSALLTPLVTATEGPGGRGLLLLVGADPDDASAELAEAAGLVPVPIGSGEPSAARFFTELVVATERVLRQQPERLQAVLTVAWATLVTKVQSAGPIAAPLAKALTDPMVAQMLVETTAAAVVARRIAPLGWIAMGVPSDVAFQPRTPAQAVLQRAALGSGLCRGAMNVDLEAGRVSTVIAEAIEDALARSPWEGETGQALATLVGSWGPAEDQLTEEILAALAARAPVDGGLDHGHAAAALVALALAGRGGAAPDDAVAAVDAAAHASRDRPRGRAAQTAGGALAKVADTRPQDAPYRQRVAPIGAPQTLLHVEGAPDPGALDVLALQIILGAPRARRHPAFRGGPRSLWARPTPRGPRGAQAATATAR
jgi:hypothetical protein